jgi:hypothetical protein
MTEDGPWRTLTAISTQKCVSVWSRRSKSEPDLTDLRLIGPYADPALSNLFSSSSRDYCKAKGGLDLNGPGVFAFHRMSKLRGINGGVNSGKK